MSLTSVLLNVLFEKGDAKRDKGLTTPENIARFDNLDYYGDKSEDHLLDVYYPKDTEKPLPAIISIHGGGWVYGNKEAYQFYCMNLAQYGFTVVNFNYRLAPKYKFPAALEDVNSVFHWVKNNSTKFHMDLNNLFIVGDSAGAQIASQYAAILTNLKYAKLFDFKMPDIKIKAMGLNHGMYDPLDRIKNKETKKWYRNLLNALMKDYLGKEIYKYEKEMDFQSNITPSFPPSFVTCSVNDGLVGIQPAFLSKLESAGLHYIYKEYGHNDKASGHVFHLDLRKDEATILNNEQIEFFHQYICK
ncbi:alpha/beta hydrolase [Bacillus albus]|uniref:alpha/beta hydrolase n=1 Tax=Bacillus TaxID=1386 RepID=UPI00100993BD|nr:alpha/beta hydrolase [Bacillus albus]MDC6157437.1 alpha/beta hydrolase [Bacillus albus]MDD8006914.1 alpha/beta hydrolase [Bacillus albus]RXJ13560.1 alpha/beta hydrolase [Bacillus albus]RXJ23199.1 alpha/beta hydrolase [Bacillus albus]RXJ26900.1 alpha/beta hydrolase [Bacillus albus]